MDRPHEVIRAAVYEGAGSKGALSYPAPPLPKKPG